MRNKFAILTLLVFATGCSVPMAPLPNRKQIPSRDYASMVRQYPGVAAARAQQPRAQLRQSGFRSSLPAQYQEHDAELRFVKDLPPEERNFRFPGVPQQENIVTNMGDSAGSNQGFIAEHHGARKPDYNGPLSLGDPGVSASLWQESNSNNDMFRDHRAFHPMDLVTIVVSESSSGSKEADTETKGESTLLAGLTDFFGYIQGDVVSKNPNLTPAELINGSVTNDYKGEGETTRSGTLTARISAMVMEVLPNGILRVEGQKIISVNEEEQVMVISGLVRPRDVSSMNEIDSSKVAQMRIDYFGRGIVGEAQHGGWLGRLLRVIWPL